MKRYGRAVAAALLLFFVSAGELYAVDGVVLINQSRTLTGNVSPGDAPGFPVSINRAGSYRLASNLVVPGGINGIEISANDVTLDLNGFRLTGGGSAKAIRSTGPYERIEIANGTISSFSNGIDLMTSSHTVVRDVRIGSNISIATGSHARIQRNDAQGLIQATCPSIISENITEGYITVVLGLGGEQCVRWNNRSLNYVGAVTQ